MNYTSIGTREETRITNEKLISIIKLKLPDRQIKIEEIINIARSRSITVEELSFTKNQVSRNPNDLIKTNKANCIGYSSMFNSIANYLIRKNGLEGSYKSKHCIGKLELLGINLHHFFDSPFLRDHDYNEIVNLRTTKVISIDTSVSDYFKIDYVSSK